MKSAALFVVVGLGCAQRSAEPRAIDPFPGDPFSGEALLSSCPVEIDSLRSEWRDRPEGPPAIAGAHPRRVLLDVRERARDLEVAGLWIDAATPAAPPPDDAQAAATVEPIYAGLRGASAFPEVELWLEPGTELSLRVLLRQRAEGGLFDSLSYCFETIERGQIEPTTTYARLVVEDPGDGSDVWLSLEQY